MVHVHYNVRVALSFVCFSSRESCVVRQRLWRGQRAGWTANRRTWPLLGTECGIERHSV